MGVLPYSEFICHTPSRPGKAPEGSYGAHRRQIARRSHPWSQPPRRRPDRPGMWSFLMPLETPEITVPGILRGKFPNPPWIHWIHESPIIAISGYLPIRPSLDQDRVCRGCQVWISSDRWPHVAGARWKLPMLNLKTCWKHVGKHQNCTDPHVPASKPSDG